MFIDNEYDTWNMDPVALEKAFEIYPEVKGIVVAHLYVLLQERTTAEQRPMHTLVVVILAQTESSLMLVWIYSTEVYVCQAITR